MTQGSVFFAGGSGALAQDNAHLYYDDLNNRLGVGTTSPTTALDVTGSITGTGLTINAGTSITTVTAPTGLSGSIDYANTNTGYSASGDRKSVV